MNDPSHRRVLPGDDFALGSVTVNCIPGRTWLLQHLGLLAGGVRGLRNKQNHS